VNNVGKAGGGDIVSTLDAEWQGALDQTLFPAIRMSRLVVPEMRRAGGGVILMVASIWGRESGDRMTYNAVKAAEISLAKAMSFQLAKDKIRVNSVAPGSIMFEGGSWAKRQRDDPEFVADMLKRDLPFGRFGTARKWDRSSRSSRPRVRAGSPARRSRWTAGNRGRISDEAITTNNEQLTISG
jgi:3-oxoacyl-[acyl-carrier protein] reductase